MAKESLLSPPALAQLSFSFLTELSLTAIKIAIAAAAARALIYSNGRVQRNCICTLYTHVYVHTAATAIISARL